MKNSGHSNPCTLVPTDFQLNGKMKHKFYFRFSFRFCLQQKKQIIIGLPCSFFIFSPPGRKRNSNSLYALRFLFCNLKKRILIFFFVFRFHFSFHMEFGKRITSRFSFSANGSVTDNLCLSGNI